MVKFGKGYITSYESVQIFDTSSGEVERAVPTFSGRPVADVDESGWMYACTGYGQYTRSDGDVRWTSPEPLCSSYIGGRYLVVWGDHVIVQESYPSSCLFVKGVPVAGWCSAGGSSLLSRTLGSQQSI